MARLVLSLVIVVVLVLAAVIVEPLLGLGDSADAGGIRDEIGSSVKAFHRAGADRVDGPNVLLISVDTLRADHMSLHGYERQTTPHIDAFSRNCRVFERAYATSPFTSPSVMSMLTGLYPYRHGIRLLWQKIEDRNIILADYLRRSGFQTAAVVSNLALGERACGLGARFDYYDDRVDEAEARRPHMLERRASRTTDAAIAWLADQRRTDRPFFLWVHYMDPHGPYCPPSAAPADFVHDQPLLMAAERIASHVRESGLLDGLEYVDRYDEEIAYTDREVGRLLEWIERCGLAEDCLVLFTADHGETLLEGESTVFCHGYDVSEAVIHVPLMVRHKSIPAGRIGQPVSITDILPTVLDVVGLPVPDGLDGRSLTGAISSRPPYAEGPDRGGSGGLSRTFVGLRHKIIVLHGRSNVVRRAWAFDLVSDPEERQRLDVDEAEPAYVVLSGLVRADPDPGGKPTRYVSGDKPHAIVPDVLDDDALRHLKNLGYANRRH